MSDAVLTRLRALLGSAGVEREADGLPRATPDSSESFAQVCHVASEEGWRIRLEGQGTWLPADAPAELALSTRALDQVVSVSPADLVATVQAGAPLDEVRRRLADQGMWLALDPPGRPDRSIGSILATATAGPLRYGFGSVRDHVLGCAVVTGDGRIVRAGGRVVKNVAGYDVTKLHVGGFGGFGVITEVHLRLRALPRADVTFTALGPRDRLAAAARAIGAASLSPSALEMFSPALAAEAEWMLAARLTGTDSAVVGEARRLSATGDVTWQQLRADRSAAFWGLTARAALAGPITLRLGVLPDGLEETIDLVGHDLDEGLVSAGGMGGLRWTGTTSVERLRSLRRAMAAREIPMTIERAPWEVRREIGHFGAYREGVGQLVSKLREAFDPKGALQVALEGSG
ncbi:MAG TPA: FAD-binding oxidoreductase [Gemmatimonadales bacterium]